MGVCVCTAARMCYSVKEGMYVRAAESTREKVSGVSLCVVHACDPQ